MAISTCEIVTRPAQPTLAIRTRTPVQNLPGILGASFGAIGQYLGELGENPVEAPFVAYYNMDMNDLDVEIGFPVARPLPARGEIQAQEIPAGRAATCLYTGPYDQMVPAYEALNAFIGSQNASASGVAYEYYLNGPETPPQELQTRIVLPLNA